MMSRGITGWSDSALLLERRKWLGLADLGLGLRLSHVLSLGLVLSLRLLFLKLVTVEWPIWLLKGGLGVHSVLIQGRFSSSATVSNIFISNDQQLLKRCGFLDPHMSGYSWIQLFVNNFPCNKVSIFFDRSTVFGTSFCSFSSSATHLYDGLCWVYLGCEPVMELLFGNTHMGIQLSLQSIMIA